MARIKKDQHQIGQINDVLRKAQSRCTLAVRIKSGGINQDFAANFF